EVLRGLSVDELVGLVSGRDLWHNHGVPRLGIPPLRFTDGPFGARGVEDGGPPSALTPCGAALGALWDVELLGQLGCLLGEEARRKGAHILLGPTVNLHRVPTAGRHFECLSEDPFLTARLAVAYIGGVQGQGVGCCVKHLVANDQERARMAVSAEVSEEALRLLHLRPFEAAVREGRVLSVMTGYNRLNGTFCSENRWLLEQVLRTEWGFEGLVVSDWFGAHSTEGCLHAGLDVEMPGWPAGMSYGPALRSAVEEGRVPRELLVRRARTVLRVMERLGLLRPGAREQEGAASRNTEGQRALLHRAAAESAVLLKNAGGALPLPARCSVAVISPAGEELEWMWGAAKREGDDYREGGDILAGAMIFPQISWRLFLSHCVPGPPAGPRTCRRS
ncbi:unnamed protein product, partial [Prorocentrum cordatum]